MMHDLYRRPAHWSRRLLWAVVAALVAGSAAASPNWLQFADRVVVYKAERRLDLIRGHEVLRSFRIALGLAPEGHKLREGDYRTPEGSYALTERNSDSEFFLSIRISYPNDHDMQRARASGVAPGGRVMIHGQPNSPHHSLEYYRRMDWTNGCIAVSNADMIDIWLMTGLNTPIEIRP
jgi:murein L,D-transpeptidase YafK